MSKQGWYSGLGFTVVWALGCTPQRYDPAEGGFLQGVSALATGGYAARVEDKQTEVRDLQRQADELRQRRAAVEQQGSDAKSRRAAAEAQLAALQQRQAKLRRQLEAANRAKRAAGSEATALQLQVEALDRDLADATVGNDATAQDLERLQRRQDEVLESLGRSLSD